MTAPKPKVSRGQQLGQIGETLVAKQVVENGFVFHPIGSGNDFGVDGRIECVGSGGVEAEEFFVQIKSTEKVGFVKDGSRLQMRPIRVGTAAYWGSKLSPTLLVVVCAATKRLWYQWAHDAIPNQVLIRAVRDGKKSVTPVVPTSNEVGPDSWKSIASAARDSYWTVVRSIYADRTKRNFLILYRTASDAYEILTDLLLEERDREEGHEPYRLPVEQIYAVILLFRALWLFSNLVTDARSELGDVGARLCRVTAGVADAIREDYLEIYADGDESYRRGADVALYGHPEHWDKLVALSAPKERVSIGIRKITLRARAFLRIVRNALFPEPPGSEVGQANPYTSLHQIAKEWLEPAPPAVGDAEAAAEQERGEPGEQ